MSDIHNTCTSWGLEDRLFVEFYSKGSRDRSNIRVVPVERLSVSVPKGQGRGNTASGSGSTT